MLTRSRARSAALTTAALTTAALTLCLAPAVAAPGSTHLGPATAGPSAPRLAAPTLTRLVTSAEDRAPETTGPAQADRLGGAEHRHHCRHSQKAADHDVGQRFPSTRRQQGMGCGNPDSAPGVGGDRGQDR